MHLLGDGLLYATRVDSRIPPVSVAGAQMFAEGILLWLIAAGTGQLWTASVPSREVVAALAMLTLIDSVLAYACYAVAIRHLPLTTVALHAYLSSVVTIALSALIRGKAPSLPMVLSAIVVFAGVALAMRRGR
jgi:drug/metabolite transporter (DMT)-like permease